jgi:hypothetical protein
MMREADEGEFDVGAALKHLEVAELHIDSAVRRRVLQRTLDRFDAEMVTVGDDEEVESPRGLIRLVEEAEHESRDWSTARRWLLAVAAVLFGLVAVRALQPVDENRFEVASDESTSTLPAPLIAARQELPVLLDVGRYESSALGTPIAFTLDRPVWLTREEPGVVELSMDPDDQMANRIAFARPTDISVAVRNWSEEVDGLIGWLNSSPEGLSIQSSAGRIGDQQVGGRWGIYLADDLVREQDCQTGRVCIDLFAEPGGLGLAPGGNNTLVQLDQDGLDPIVVISWSPQSAGLTTYGAFGPTMETLEVGKPEQSPLADG